MIIHSDEIELQLSLLALCRDGQSMATTLTAAVQPLAVLLQATFVHGRCLCAPAHAGSAILHYSLSIVHQLPAVQLD